MASLSPEKYKMNSFSQMNNTQACLISDVAPLPVRSAEFFQQNYKKLDKLGTGGFGTVWKGIRNIDSTPVAIKEIKKDSVTQWGEVDGKSVPMEAMFLMKLRRVDGVIKILDLCVADDVIIIIMERPKWSVDLFDYISERRRLHPGEARRVMKAVVRILVACRRRGVFHGDLKDENILIDVYTKETKLIDFGGAMTWTKGPCRKFMGTGLWSPPECNKREAFYPECATAWSLGCLLHVTLAGDIPFKSKIGAISGQLDLDESILDQRAVDLIKRCLEVNVEKRMSLAEISSHPWLNNRNRRDNVRRRGSATSWKTTSERWIGNRNQERGQELRSTDDWLRARMTPPSQMIEGSQGSAKEVLEETKAEGEHQSVALNEIKTVEARSEKLKPEGNSEADRDHESKTLFFDAIQAKDK